MMTLEAILQRCKEHGIHLRVDSGNLCFRAAKGAMTNELIDKIKDFKEEIIEFLTRQPLGREAEEFQLQRAASGEHALIYDHAHWVDYPGRIMEVGVANAPHIVLRLNESIQPVVMRKAIAALLARHEVLSSVVKRINGQLYIVRCPTQQPLLHESVYDDGPAVDREQNAMRVASDLVWAEYDLDFGPLYRVFVLKISESDTIFGLGIHHAICDGISIGIALHELLALYRSALTGALNPLHAVTINYIDFVVSMNRWLDHPAGQSKLDFWIDNIKSSPQTHLRFSDRKSQGHTVGTSVSEAMIKLDSVVSEKLLNVAAQMQTTLFTLLLVAQKVATWRTTGLTEPVIVVISGLRNNRELQFTIGNFASEIAYKTSLAESATLKGVVDRLKKVIVEAEHYQPIPFDLVRRKLRECGVDFSAPTVGFSSADDSIEDERSASQHQPQRLRFNRPAPMNGFPGTYSIQFRRLSQGIQGEMIYRNEFYDEEIVSEFTKAFEAVINALIETPDLPLARINFASPVCRRVFLGNDP